MMGSESARWMDPSTGTFLSVDPVVADYTDPQSYNAYAYARNNPVNWIDPTGMIGVPEFHHAHSHAQGTWLFNVYTNSAEAAAAIWLSPLEAPPVPGPSSPSGVTFSGAGVGSGLGGFGGGGGSGAAGAQTSSLSGQQATQSPAASGTEALAAAADALAVAGLGVATTSEVAKVFPSTKELAPKLTRLLTRQVVPAEMAINAARAVGEAQKGETGQATASLTDAAVAGGLTYALPALGIHPAVPIGLGLGYFLAGGSRGFAGAFEALINPTGFPSSMGWPGAPPPVSASFVGRR